MILNIFLLSTDELSLGTVLIVMLFAVLLGGILTMTYAFTHRLEGFDRSFCVTLLMLPIVVSVIIMLVSNNIARAFSLAGVFTLIRFRSTLSDTKDITFIFASVAIGLICGMGYTGYGIVVALFIALLMGLLHIIHFDAETESRARLKIVIPESLNYPHAFDSVFMKYLKSYKLNRVKTTDFGTTFELTYDIQFKPDINQKGFLDDLRVKNSNLNIALTSAYVAQVTES
ncbi:MAG: DUF4956 domain-containing protein [Candidatus Izemoplasmatales bacterium]|nr:DUF4956 domain-containing protein [Candidatus Izemoplasmatales bacterium]MDD5293265.1 DUF4956 domain-containing protein [Candidatus Izemoplasmatales bacterium]